MYYSLCNLARRRHTTTVQLRFPDDTDNSQLRFQRKMKHRAI
jgi:hypothetical protein